MCCAQTAAPKGKKHKRWEMEKRGYRSIKSSTQRSARSVVGSVASKHSGKLSDMLLHETAVAWLRWKLQPSTQHAFGWFRHPGDAKFCNKGLRRRTYREGVTTSGPLFGGDMSASVQVATNTPKSRPKAP